MFFAVSALSMLRRSMAVLTYRTSVANYTHITQTGDPGFLARRWRGEPLQVMPSPEELALIDDFRFAKRMPSRAATVRELFRRGLAAEGFTLAPVGTKSKDFGVAIKSTRLAGRRKPNGSAVVARASE